MFQHAYLKIATSNENIEHVLEDVGKDARTFLRLTPQQMYVLYNFLLVGKTKSTFILVYLFHSVCVYKYFKILW